MKSREMIASHPAHSESDADALARCIDDCFACAQACTTCADACLHENDPAKLQFCIHTDLDCADICLATGRTLSRASRPDATLMQAMLEACAVACETCASECQKHAGNHRHCSICAEACRRCEESCRELLAATPAA